MPKLKRENKNSRITEIEKHKVVRLLAAGQSFRKIRAVMNRSLPTIQKISDDNKTLIETMKDKMNLRLIEEAEPSINTLVELRDEAEAEMVRFNAAKELLTKAEVRVGTTTMRNTALIINVNAFDREPERKFIEIQQDQDNVVEESEESQP